jgi:ketosteroid isomerase-like protein
LRGCSAWVFALALASLLASTLYAAQSKPLTVLEGKLVANQGECPLLKVNGRDQTLSADTPHLYHTMQDRRLDGREVRLEGIPKPDGSFEVHWLYTVHDGKLFRVRYFCSTCNIVALEPGPCVCCQQPVALQEIPVEKPEI